MSIRDYVLDGGIEVVGSGEGWSIWHECNTGRWRFDVMSGETHRSVPMLTARVTPEHAEAVKQRLNIEVKHHPDIAGPAAAMQAFIDQRWPAHG